MVKLTCLLLLSLCLSQTYAGSCKTKTFEASAQTTITKGKLLTTLPKVGKVHEVSFEVKPTRFVVNQWTSVIHFTIGKNHGRYGDRVPGVWFIKSAWSKTTNSLHICSPINGNVNDCFNSEKFPLNQWIKVKISQTKILNFYEYVITINEKKVYYKRNWKPASFDNVNVYAGGEWAPAQPGYIRNLEVTGGSCKDTTLASAQTKIIKGKLLKVLPKFGKVYEVSFEVYPTQFKTNWGNIIHFSKGGNHARYGDRTPAVWFFPSSSNAATENKFHICSAVNADKNYCYDSAKFSRNKWIKVKISQTKISGYYEFVITINDKKVHQIRNLYPESFDNVKVYASDPWYNAQSGYIRNLKVTSDE